MRQKRRGSRPPLTRALILKWINRRKTGGLPAADSGPVVGQPGEDWRAINACLRLGLRGLPGGSSIARLLGEAGLKPYRRDVPLTIEEIVNWLEGDHQETGKWPTRKSGTVRAAPGET